MDSRSSTSSSLYCNAQSIDIFILYNHICIWIKMEKQTFNDLCKKCTKPATHRVLNPATKNAQYPASVTEMIRPLLNSERDFISI